MPIPDYETLMLPLLEAIADGKEHGVREVRDVLGHRFELTDKERLELLPSGKQPYFDNRVGWAKTYLEKAGLLQSIRRGTYRLSDRGRTLLANKPGSIDRSFLMRFPEFQEFWRRSRDAENDDKDDIRPGVTESKVTPQEALESSYALLRRNLESDLLTAVMKASPTFFERLVVELLVNMGYGGSREDAGERLGRSGDGGIDGIIKEDRLGLDAIYVQAKRWDKPIGRPIVQAFSGSLDGVRARKGVLITTSRFSDDAEDYVKQIDKKIVLIDGKRLASLMVDFNVGVSNETLYEVKRIDVDYFSEE